MHASDLDERRTAASNFDAPLSVILLLLAFGGLLVLYAASAVMASRWTGEAEFYFLKQLGWLGIGLCAMLVMALMPLHLLQRIAPLAMMGSILLLGLVWLPGIGHSVASSRDEFHRWLKIGSMTVQPSEFAKLALVLYTAWLIQRLNAFHQSYDLKQLTVPAVLIAIQLVEVVLEPQYGTTLCLIVFLVLMIYISGFPVLRLALVFLAVVPLLVILVIFWEYRFARVYVWLDPWAHRYSGGYQLVTAFKAIAEGGWWGTAPGSGFAHRYLTFGHTDFVFALFVEDFGLPGVIVLFGLFIAFLLRSWYLIRKLQHDTFAYALGIGIILMLYIQIVLNIFVVTGLVPTTGVSLPWFSYGGSSLVVSMAMGGLLLNLGSIPPQTVELTKTRADDQT
ncbi:MAG: FtsW/RodA/SpoVE family cell cycle protein [Leptospiraceae bacterium]|nr:FtsW/RodA/SpoVE family cell cycle protein [Leptospiraceae bacterium]